MNKEIISACIIGFAFSSTIYAEDLPPDLIKVTPENNPRCVEYFSSNGDMYCSTKASTKEEVDPQIVNAEKQHISFDDRQWQAAWTNKTPEITMIEYVPKGESIEDWNELVTSQFIPDIQNKVTPKEYANVVMNNLRDSGFSPLISFHENTPQQVIFEFRITSPENLQQDEIQKITKGRDGFYILHYVIKKDDMGQENRQKWLTILKNSTIK